LDGLIVYGNGTCIVLRPSYLHYFSGFKPMGLRNAAVLSRTGETTLLVEPQWDHLRASQQSWIEDVRGSTDFIGDLTEILTQKGLTGRIGVVGSVEMTRDVYQAIEARAEVEIVDEVFDDIAREKTEEEREVVRKAVAIADRGFDALLDAIRVGVREYELAAETEWAMRDAGADDIFLLLGTGKHNYEMHDPRDRRLERGDLIIAEITPGCEGQFVQICRTVVVGEPTPLVREKYAMLMEAQEKALKEVKAGVAASVISIAINKVIGDAGYAKYCHPPYMRARGHGFGPGTIAPGGLIEDTTEELFEKDQAIVVHPNQYLPETGYLACGEMALVTEIGAEVLSKRQTKLYVKEG
jgi:Xaa-Pro aminopeptidase